jgi:hypothetical protein
MKPFSATKKTKSPLGTDSPSLAQVSGKNLTRRRNISGAVGMKVLPTPVLPLVSTFTVQLVTPETIAAGFPFGMRINVEALTPQSAAEIASEDFRRLADSIRGEARAGLAAQLSRACAGA